MVKRRRKAPPEAVGVPLGGVGTGYMELGRDGRFRNITTQNNRTVESAIPVSKGAFLAVRAVAKGRIFARLLQTGSGLPFEQAGIVPPYAAPEEISWRGLYPVSSYTLNDPKFPLAVNWVAFSPVIPYDTDSSSMPVILVRVQFENHTDSPVDASAVFNWENLAGCTGRRTVEARGPARPVVLKEEEDILPNDSQRTRGEKPQPAGLVFGFREPPITNEEGSYCLVAKQVHGFELSLMTWNERSPGDLLAFWRRFYEEGYLGNLLSRDKLSHSGAVCGSCTIQPGERQNILFALSWHFPRFEMNGRNQGNGYANRFSSSTKVAEKGLKYFSYYQRSVNDWQQRFLASSLPRWLGRMLINNCHTLTTNSLQTKDGDFALLESLEEPYAGQLSDGFYSSIGPLLFYPDMANRELTLIGNAVQAGDPGRLCTNLGRMAINAPEFNPDQGEALDLGPKFVLMVYRSYCMTGKLVTLVNLFPRVTEVMRHLATKEGQPGKLPAETNQPAAYGECRVDGTTSYAAGLWIAALRAYVRMARRLKKNKEAERFEPLIEPAIESFEKELWNESAGHYDFAREIDASDHEHHAHACHTGQLAGHWASLFLGLGPLFSEEHVQKALMAITKTNTTNSGMAELRSSGKSPAPVLASDLSFPYLSAAYYCALQIYSRNVDRGLYAFKTLYDTLHVKAGAPFSQPFQWDVEKDCPGKHHHYRHISALSAWHVFFALQGFHLNMAEQTLRIQPNLPMNVYQLDAPLFTPLCFGWVKFIERDQGAYEQRITISFDSPIQVKTIVLRVPERVGAVSVHCDVEEKVAHAVHTVTQEQPGVRLVSLNTAQPIEVGSGVTITLREIPQPAPTGSPGAVSKT